MLGEAALKVITFGILCPYVRWAMAYSEKGKGGFLCKLWLNQLHLVHVKVPRVDWPSMVITRTMSYEGTSMVLSHCGPIVKHTCSVWEMVLEEVVHLPEQHVVGVHCQTYHKD